MSDTFEGVKAVVVDVMKIDEEGLTQETRFIEDLKAELDGSILLDRRTV